MKAILILIIFLCYQRPTLFYRKLPPHVTSMKVLLLDPMLATGGSACLAIECLLEAGVPVENITFLNLVSCADGLLRIRNTYPSLKVVTSMVDPILNDDKVFRYIHRR